MKRIIFVAMLMVMGAVAIAAAQCGTPAKAATPAGTPAAKTAAAPTTTLTGEVVDLSCYMGHGAMGADHSKCAMSCITKGQPVGFLTSDGALYVILGQNHQTANAQVVNFAGKKSTITGTVKEDKGLKAIELASIAEAK